MPSEASAEEVCPRALCLFVAKRIGYRPTLRRRRLRPVANTV